MHAERHVVTLTGDGSGAATGYTPVVTGRVLQIHLDKGNFDSTLDVAITSEATGQNIWTQSDQSASTVKAPRQPTHDAAGAASLYASGGEPVEDYIVLAKDRVKIVLAQAGAGKTGTFHVVIG